MGGEDSRSGGPWVRFEPPLLPGPGLLARLLEVGRPGYRASGIEFIDRGVVNSNYRVDLAGPDGGAAAPVLLRLSRSLAGADREAELGRRLASVAPGLVAAPLALVREDRPEPHGARLVEWIDGVPLDEAAPGGDSPELLPAARDLGTLLGRLHRVRPGGFGRLEADLSVAPPRDGEPPPDTYGEEIARRIHLRLENPAHGLDGAVHERLEALLDRLVRLADREAPRASSLVHGDLSPGNILLRREGGAWRLAGLIDWEMARAATPAVDHASLVFEAGTRWPLFSEAAIDSSRGDGAGPVRDASFDLALLLLLLDARMVALVRRSAPHLKAVDSGLRELAERGEGVE
jgi:aminoglycoside phosphotransferase (APT) family kinase protein